MKRITIKFLLLLVIISVFSIYLPTVFPSYDLQRKIVKETSAFVSDVIWRDESNLIWDDGDPENHLWNSPLNWDPNHVPTRRDTAFIDLQNSICEIKSSIDAECERCVVGYTCGPCYLEITGGVLNCTGGFHIGYERGSIGHVKLYGGIMKVGNLQLGLRGGVGTMEIRKGILMLNGDYESLIKDYVNDGLITAYNGSGVINIEYNEITRITTVTAVLRDLSKAWKPLPEDGGVIEIGKEKRIILRWLSGEGAILHDIYFGTDFERVNNATRPSSEYIGRQSSNFYEVRGLAYGKTYYWRVDEIDISNENSPSKGEVWCFTTAWYRTVDGLDKDIVVGVFYYPWYGSDAHHTTDGLRGHLDPQQHLMVGDDYSSRAMNVISAHINYSHRANIDFWVCSWWGPNTYTDITFKDYILTHPQVSELKYCIYYETIGRLGSGDNPDYRNLLPDFDYLSENYFNNSNYLKIDGHPVVYVYLAGEYFNEDHGYHELAALRKAHPEVFLVGDILSSSIKEVSKWDAIHTYCIANYFSPGATHADLIHLNQDYYHARNAATRANIGFVPVASPGFNNKYGKGTKGSVFTRYFTDDRNSVEGDVFREILSKIAIPKVHQIAGNMLVVSTWNEWHEDSSIEPTRGTTGVTNRDTSHSSYEYTQGYYYTDYGELYLDILSQETKRFSLKIVHPKENYLYVFDREIISVYTTIIIGRITIEGEIHGDNVENVEFYIDDKLEYIDYDKPYLWRWDEFIIGMHRIKVIAYDNQGNTAEDKLDVIIFNFRGRK